MEKYFAQQGQIIFMNELQELHNNYKLQYEQYGKEQMIDDCINETACRMSNYISLDTINKVFKNEVEDKLKNEKINSLEELSIKILTEFLMNTIDLSDAYKLLGVDKND